MCDRPRLAAEFHVDVDPSGRPLLCGVLRGWLHSAPDSLPGLEITYQEWPLDGVTLSELNRLVMEVMPLTQR